MSERKFSYLTYLLNIKSLCLLFLSEFYFSPNDSPSEIWKLFFISSKKLFSFSRYSNFCTFVFPSFFPFLDHWGWSKKNSKVYDVINCPNKNLITHFVSYLEKEIRCDIEILLLDRETFYMEKSCRKCAPKARSRPLFNFAK